MVCGRCRQFGRKIGQATVNSLGFIFNFHHFVHYKYSFHTKYLKCCDVPVISLTVKLAHAINT